MAKQLRGKVSKNAKASGPRIAPAPRERAPQGQLERGVREIEKAIADVQRGLARAERRIETDARQQIRGLRKEGRAQMRSLEAKRREASRLLDRLSVAAEESWEDVDRTVRTMVDDARTTANAVVERFRSVLS